MKSFAQKAGIVSLVCLSAVLIYWAGRLDGARGIRYEAIAAQVAEWKERKCPHGGKVFVWKPCTHKQEEEK